jgi:hypothetical protein
MPLDGRWRSAVLQAKDALSEVAQRIVAALLSVWAEDPYLLLKMIA